MRAIVAPVPHSWDRLVQFRRADSEHGTIQITHVAKAGTVNTFCPLDGRPDRIRGHLMEVPSAIGSLAGIAEMAIQNQPLVQRSIHREFSIIQASIEEERIATRITLVRRMETSSGRG